MGHYVGPPSAQRRSYPESAQRYPEP